MFGLFKKKEQKEVPTLKDGTKKTFDYFAFKVHGVSSIDGVQEMLKKIGAGLYEEPKNVDLKVDAEHGLSVYVNKKRIGSGDEQALKKFNENCVKKKWNVHSLAVYGGDGDKSFGCKVRVKYFY